MSKTYLIVGGSSGIGLALSQRLVNENHTVFVLSREKPPSESPLKHYPCDVLENALPEINTPIDGLAYLPGSITLKPFANLSEGDYRKDWEINVLGAIRVIKHYLPLLKQSHHTSVVLMSSVAADQGMPFHASVGSAKAAVEGLTRSLAAEFSPNIRFNAVAPSLTNTRMAEHLLSNKEKQKKAALRHPLQKIGSPAEVAHAIHFLLSEEASWVTGQVIHVDGGLSNLTLF